METIITRKVKESLIELLAEAANSAQTGGQLTFEVLPQIMLEVPKDKSHGNFSSNLALILAKSVRKSPRETAQIIISHLATNPYVERTEVAGPGFINFHLNRNI